MSYFEKYQPDGELRPVIVSILSGSQKSGNAAIDRPDLFSHRLHGVSMLRTIGILNPEKFCSDSNDPNAEDFKSYSEAALSIAIGLRNKLNTHILFINVNVTENLSHDIVLELPKTFPPNVAEPIIHNFDVSKYDYVKRDLKMGGGLVGHVLGRSKEILGFQLSLHSRLSSRQSIKLSMLEKVFEETVAFGLVFLPK